MYENIFMAAVTHVGAAVTHVRSRSTYGLVRATATHVEGSPQHTGTPAGSHSSPTHAADNCITLIMRVRLYIAASIVFILIFVAHIFLGGTLEQTPWMNDVKNRICRNLVPENNRGLNIINICYSSNSSVNAAVATDETSAVRSPSNAVFLQRCYRYGNLTARNTCCDVWDYHNSTGDVTKCLQRLTEDDHRKENNKTTQMLPKNSRVKMKAQQWVLLGDSHMRYIFASIIYNFDERDLKYRFTKFPKDEWREFHRFDKNMRFQVYHEDIRIMHKHLPLRITFQWDPMLQRLPAILKSWEDNVELKPTYLVMGSSLHYIEHRKTLKNYIDTLHNIRPALQKLANSNLVIYKLLDHLQFQDEGSPKSPLNIDRFNNATWNIFKDSGIVVWDSTVPLSDLYNAECQRPIRRDKNKFRLWACKDKNHIGFIAVDQYANMIFNRICNKVMDGGRKNYCTT